MFRTDFSRLGQLFYDEVGNKGKEKEVSLPGFMRDAYAQYQQRFIHPGLITEGVRRAEYIGDERTNNLSINVVTSHNRPEITGMSMNGKSDDLGYLFGLLRGTVQAEFSGIKLKEVAETFNINREEVKSRGHILTRSLGLYFGSIGDDYVLQRARTEEKVSRRIIFSRYVPIPLAEVSLDKVALQLLTRADHITLVNSGCISNDVDLSLVHESCSITQPRPGEYHWNYEMHAANNEGIPAQMLPTLEDLFSQIKQKFSLKSFQNMTMTNPRQIQMTSSQ